MKALLFSLLTCALASAASAQYSIDWFSVDGGGGISSGGEYVLSGTIGQPDAATLSGGEFTLSAGFWGVVAAIQTPEAPHLTIVANAANTIAVSWPGPAPGWVLQVATGLSSTPVLWSNLPGPYQAADSRLLYVEPVSQGNRYFRLYKP
jgi:hypothetical protein